jgi:hypothetical protein
VPPGTVVRGEIVGAGYEVDLEAPGMAAGRSAAAKVALALSTSPRRHIKCRASPS